MHGPLRRRALRVIRTHQSGIGLPEILVSLVLLGAVGGVLLSALVTVTMSTPMIEERTRAKDIAETQLESIRGQDYDFTNDPPQYQLISDIPSGYSVSVTGIRLDADNDGPLDDDGIQRITVSVSHGAKTVTVLSHYKVRR